MVLSEQQLSTWSHVGAETSSARTYDRIKSIIQNSNFSKKNEVIIYLQGSYGNDTYIRADMDVDIVIELKTGSIYYGHDQLRQELITIFSSTLGSQNVIPKSRCINLNLGQGYMSADVIPCLTYKTNGVEGISIKKTDGRVIFNFPKHHKDNGTQKHQATSQQYKKVVRIFKNIRNKLIEDRKISSDLAPSYFIECLIYNIPNSSFNNNISTCMYNCLVWLNDNKNSINHLKCQNGVSYLFGADETQWTITNCQIFISAVIALWNGN